MKKLTFFLCLFFLMVCCACSDSSSSSSVARGWRTAELIETDDAGDASYPQVAVDSSGNAVAVWQQHDGTCFNIWSNRYTAATGRWGTAELIETDAWDAYDPQVAVDSSGNAVAVWFQHDGTRNNIWSNRYTAQRDVGDGRAHRDGQCGMPGIPR